jgi:hypothetical protein
MVSSKSLGTRVWGVLMLALGTLLVIVAGGMVLTNWRDWPFAAASVVLGGVFGEGGVHFLRRAGKPVFEIDPTGVTYHPVHSRTLAQHGGYSPGVWTSFLLSSMR